MAEMIAVGNTIQPPDPQKGLGMLSSIIGIQRQQQQLQTGQYQQQSAAAEAQQQQLAASQQQGVQNFFSTWDPAEHISKDGTTDLDSALQSNEFKGAGNAKPGIMQALLDIKTKQLSNKQSLAGLNSTLLAQLSSQAGAAAKDDDVVADKADPGTGVNAGRAKVKQIFDNFSQNSPDAARVAQIYAPMVEHAPQGKLSAAIQALQMSAQDVAGQQGQQNPASGSVDTGAHIFPTVTPRATGVPQLTGQDFPKQPGPTETPEYRGAVASTVSRATGVAGTDVDRQNLISNSIRPSKAGIELTKQIDGLAEIVHTGKISSEFSKAAAALGISDATSARQLLEKDLGQLKSIATSNAPSNEARDTILSGYPSAETDTSVIHAAMDYIRGSFKQNLARGELLQTYRKHRPNLEGLAGADDSLTSRFDPKMTEFMSLKTPAERTEFYKRNFHTKQEAHEFKSQMSGNNGP